jgi:hypothetical protein
MAVFGGRFLLHAKTERMFGEKSRKGDNLNESVFQMLEYHHGSARWKL